MPEQNHIERLDEAIDRVLAGRRDDLALAAPELAMLLLIAEDLRDLPDPGFRERLKSQLIPETTATQPIMETDYPTVIPYLVVDGAAALIDFLKEGFGARERLRVPRPDGSVMHAELVIGNSVVELADATLAQQPIRMPLHLYVDDADALYERAARAGGTTLFAPMDQPYGNREAGILDRWGNHWYISTRQEDVDDDEVMRRFEGRGSTPRRDPSIAPIPPGFRTVTLGVRVPGAGHLIDFLKSAFSATEEHRTAMPDGTIVHAVVHIGDSVLELGEPHGEWGPMPVHIHLFVDDPDATYARAVAAGAETIFAPNDTAYGQRMGAVNDPFGNSWFIAKML